MKLNKTKKKLFFLNVGVLSLSLATVSCIKDIDESDLYTSTEDTVESFIQKDSTLSAFNYILTRSGYAQKMATYGQYTCFAPDNEAVMDYIDSLYNASEAKIEHNGMTSNSLEGLSDSLCTDIAEFHIAAGLVSAVNMSGGTTVNTMLGRSFSTQTDSVSTSKNYGMTVLNDVAGITSADNEVSNGYVHKINAVIPRSSRTIADVLKSLGDEYSIFYDALIATGLGDSLTKIKRDVTYSMTDANHLDTDGNSLFYPKECKYGFTLFAESNDVFKAAGINSFDDLKAKVNEWYGGAASWYSYLNEKGIQVSTGTDYTNRNNALNMFVAYHLLRVSMAQNEMVFENNGATKNTSAWNYYNYCNGGEPYDYYETMLPNTLIKIWRPAKTGTKLWINRWVRNNTLTDEVGTMGSDAMHDVLFKGVEIVRKDIQAINGYIHPIKSVLLYDKDVPDGVLHERLRFDATTFLNEFINNGFRNKTMSQISADNGGGSGARVAFPLNYFENVVSYTSKNQFRYNVRGKYGAYQADAFQGWGQYDLAVKLPHVPKSGLYEFRLYYAPMSHGGFMQFYLGTSSNIQDMQALGIPLDVRIDETDPRIGFTQFSEEDDQGVTTDQAMRTRGYMRGPYSFMAHPERGTGDSKTTANCRADDGGNVFLRRVLGNVDMKQSQDYWFRIKNVFPGSDDLKWQLDFIELVPVDVIENDQYSEDWY